MFHNLNAFGEKLFIFLALIYSIIITIGVWKMAAQDRWPDITDGISAISGYTILYLLIENDFRRRKGG